MAYLGNAPARSFISFERQVFTIVNSQTAYTLDHSVNNENDLRLVINNIVQEPGSGKAYTASGTTLTLSAALTNGTDEMYCVFLGRATATNAPGAGSVNTAAIAADAITEAKIADDAVESEHLNDNVISGQTELAAEPANTDEFLVSDAGTLKRVDYSYIKGLGRLGQVVYQSTVFDSSHSSDTQVATLSITPSSASSTILIMSTIVAQPDNDEYGSVDIYRGTLASGSKVFDAGDVFFHNAGNAIRCHYTFSYIDSPSTTSAQSYSIVVSPQYSGTVRYGCGASNMLQLWEILP